MENNEELIEKAGRWGNYQFIIGLIVILSALPFPMLLVTLPMMQKEPAFMFYDKQIETFVQVTDKENFCRKVYYSEPLYNIFDDIKLDHSNSILNWAYELKLVCNTREILAFVGTVYFLASMTSNLVLSKYPDRYGRRNIYMFFNFLTMIVLIQLVYLNHLGQLIVAAFVIGLGSINQAIGSILINENIDNKYSGLIMGICNAMFPIGGILNTVIIYYFQNWRYYLFFNIIIIVIINILCLLYMKETPKWLIANQCQKEFLETIYYIAKFNGRENLIQNDYVKLMSDVLIRKRSNSITISENHEEYRKHVYGLKDLIKYKSIRMMTLKNLYLWIITGFSFFGLLLNLEGLTGNIYTDALVMYSAEGIAEISSGIASLKYGRKNTALISFILATTGSFLFKFITMYNINIIFLFISAIGVASGFNILYIYSSELYPTNIKSLSISIFSLFNRLAACIIPILLTFTRDITLIIAFLNLGAIFVVLTMPESLGYECGDEIKEMEGKIYEKVEENDEYLYFHDVFDHSF